MEFKGTLAARLNEVIKFRYVHELTEEESKDFKEFIEELFMTEGVETLGVVNPELRIFINREPPDYTPFALLGKTEMLNPWYQAKKIDEYIKEHFDAQYLSISDCFFDGKKLICYSLTRNKKPKPLEIPPKKLSRWEQLMSLFCKE